MLSSMKKFFWMYALGFCLLISNAFGIGSQNLTSIPTTQSESPNQMYTTWYADYTGITNYNEGTTPTPCPAGTIYVPNSFIYMQAIDQGAYSVYQCTTNFSLLQMQNLPGLSSNASSPSYWAPLNTQYTKYYTTSSQIKFPVGIGGAGLGAGKGGILSGTCTVTSGNAFYKANGDPYLATSPTGVQVNADNVVFTCASMNTSCSWSYQSSLCANNPNPGSCTSTSGSGLVNWSAPMDFTFYIKAGDSMTCGIARTFDPSFTPVKATCSINQTKSIPAGKALVITCCGSTPDTAYCAMNAWGSSSGYNSPGFCPTGWQNGSVPPNC